MFWKAVFLDRLKNVRKISALSIWLESHSISLAIHWCLWVIFGAIYLLSLPATYMWCDRCLTTPPPLSCCRVDCPIFPFRWANHYTFKTNSYCSYQTVNLAKYVIFQVNLGSTMTMTSNSRQTSEGQAQPSQPSNQSEPQGQAPPPPPPNGASQQAGHGQGTPRVIRITHQTMEPVVMMQMNLDGMPTKQPTQSDPSDFSTVFQPCCPFLVCFTSKDPKYFSSSFRFLRFKIVAFRKWLFQTWNGLL